MRFLLQRVQSAAVTVASEPIASIGQGICVFVGIAESDTEAHLKPMLEKLLNLRIFANEKGLFDHSLLDIKGDLLWVSQFTLMADCKKGRRPFFGSAAKPEKAKQLYEKGFTLAQGYPLGTVACGQFGADMQVSIMNDGPVTLMLDA